MYTFKLFYLIFETILRYVGLAGRDIHVLTIQEQTATEQQRLLHIVVCRFSQYHISARTKSRSEDYCNRIP